VSANVHLLERESITGMHTQDEQSDRRTVGIQAEIRPKIEIASFSNINTLKCSS